MWMSSNGMSGLRVAFRKCRNRLICLGFPKSALKSSSVKVNEPRNGDANCKPFCTTTSRPFQRDIAEIKRITAKLQDLQQSKSGANSRRSKRHLNKVMALTSDALCYARERNSLWKKQDAKQEITDNDKFGCDFHDGHLPYLNSQVL